MKAAVVLAWPAPTARQRMEGEYPVALEYADGHLRLHVVTACLHRWHELPIDELEQVLAAIRGWE